MGSLMQYLSQNLVPVLVLIALAIGLTVVVFKRRLFERGYRRNRDAPLSLEGPVCTDAEGNGARMSLDLAEGPHEVVLDYTRHTPARRVGLSISVVTVIAGTAFMLTRRR